MDRICMFFAEHIQGEQKIDDKDEHNSRCHDDKGIFDKGFLHREASFLSDFF